MIGLSGKSGAGKDLAFKYIKEVIPEAEKVSFSDTLKLAASTIVGCSKFDFEDREFKEKKLEDFDMTGREFLQKMGVGLRECIDPDIWVKAALKKSSIFTVFTDVRFPNEAKTIDFYGGTLIRIERFADYSEWAALAGFEPRKVTDYTMDKDTFIRMATERGEDVSALLNISETALDGYDFENVIRPDSKEELKRNILAHLGLVV